MMNWAITYGTSGSVKSNHDAGVTGIRNYQDAVLPGIENLDATTIFPLLVKNRDTCNRCPVRCKLVVSYEGEENIDSRYGGPEYESIGGLGPLCGINDTVWIQFLRAAQLPLPWIAPKKTSYPDLTFYPSLVMDKAC
jgi:aldehyde:ferredoxin oxidoreductase